jgi:arylsulfatase
LDLTGSQYPHEIANREITPTEGVSLVPAIYGEEQRGRDTLFWEHQFNKAVRVGDWKLVSAFKILDKKGKYDQWELYNLRNDPTEQNDLSIQYPEKVKEMSVMYEKWAEKVGALSKEEMKSR